MVNTDILELASLHNEADAFMPSLVILIENCKSVSNSPGCRGHATDDSY